MFTHLHVHTQYSLLDGAASIESVVKRAKDLGMNSLAITDHGVMYGVVDFYLEAKKNQIKPIIGCEVYVAPKSRFDKENTGVKYYHLVLLAKNNIGYKNLMTLCSLAFIDGYYYRPRVDDELLEKYSEGLIALSGCLKGEISSNIASGNYEKAKDTAKKYKNIFGNDFYIEIQDQSIPEQKLVNMQLIKLSKELDIELVATNDVHYTNKEDAYIQDVLLCIQTGKKLSDTDRMKFSTDMFYLKSEEEMLEIFSAVPKALQNTQKIADMCNVELDFDNIYLPKFISDDKSISNFEYLKNLCIKGAKKRYKQVDEKILQRINYELDTIHKMGYTDYFLIVWDFVKYSKDNGIMVGPGRGSAAGSVVSYVLGITNVDPIEFNLLFERFLNPERVSMPDIDIDFCYIRRDDVRKYVANRYGKDHVSQIATFGTMAARAAIRDVGRVLDIPYALVDLVAKMIPSRLDITIDDAMIQNPDLKKAYETDYEVKKMIDTSKKLEGFPRHVSTHAAGVVISDGKIYDYVPVQTSEQGLLTQFTMKNLEKLGLLKMDFLGLRNLTIIRDTLDFVRRYKNIEIDIENLNYNDKDTLRLISKGDTEGVFQLESPGMKSFLRELKPSCFEDIIVGISLYRPGAMGQIDTYLKNRERPADIKYKHPLLKPILKPTYGSIVYQEQVMQIALSLAGYSYGRADIMRRAMAKRKHDVMEKEKDIFLNGLKDDDGKVLITGAVKNGIPKEVAESIYDELELFANYAFNKSHAAAYAMLAYQTAYLKCHYPTEFLAAMLKSILGNSDKIAKYMDDFSKYSINLLPPDINKSGASFTIEGNDIRFGLSALKNVGLKFPESLCMERMKNGNFKSFTDFAVRMADKDLNKRMVESMIKSGVFDSIYKNRRVLLDNYEAVIDAAVRGSSSVGKNQVTWFETEKTSPSDDDFVIKEDFDRKTKLMFENELSGMYFSGHPLDDFRLKVKAFSSTNIYEIKEKAKDSSNVRICGLVKRRTDKRTKNGSRMAVLSIEDRYGVIETVVFSQALSKSDYLLKEGSAICIDAEVSIKSDEEASLILKAAYDLESLNIDSRKSLYIKVSDAKEFEKAVSILSKNKGNTDVYIYLESTKKLIKSKDENKISMSNHLIKELEDTFGRECVKIK